VFQAPTMDSARSIVVRFTEEDCRAEVLLAEVLGLDRFGADRFAVDGIRPRLYSAPIPTHDRKHAKRNGT